MNKIIATCPVCQKKMIATKLKCNHCKSELSGEFALSPFDSLNDQQRDFALLFLLCDGNIKDIEKKMNISYPTVKKNLEEVKAALGYNNKVTFSSIDEKRELIKEKLKKGEITLDEIEDELGDNL